MKWKLYSWRTPIDADVLILGFAKYRGRHVVERAWIAVPGMLLALHSSHNVLRFVRSCVKRGQWNERMPRPPNRVIDTAVKLMRKRLRKERMV